MDDILNRFIGETPVAVMVRASLMRILNDTALNDLFNSHAEAQYTRDLTFSTVVDLMTDVVFTKFDSVHASYRHRSNVPVSITAVYDKLGHLETGISQALVGETASSMRDVILALPNAPAESVPGLRLRTLDGNFLAGTDHRLGCLRDSGAAALPGMSLVVRDGRTGLLTDIIPYEDAYTSERAVHRDVMALVKANDLWLGDRNFCTNDYMTGIAERGAFFLIRHHQGAPLQALGRETRRERYSDCTISEQRVSVGGLVCRCIIVRLVKPLADGTTVIRLLTNAPRKQLSARRAANLYRTRWKIETAFQELTVNLQCEINTLGYPKAALFGFALAIVSYNLLVVTRAALASGLSKKDVTEADLSSYHFAVEVETTDRGMSIAVPLEAWEPFLRMSVKEFATWLHKTAQGLNWRRYRKNPRGPKKPRKVVRTRRGAHRSTARVLLNARK
jgi:hypothetical protein